MLVLYLLMLGCSLAEKEWKSASFSAKGSNDAANHLSTGNDVSELRIGSSMSQVSNEYTWCLDTSLEVPPGRRVIRGPRSSSTIG